MLWRDSGSFKERQMKSGYWAHGVHRGEFMVNNRKLIFPWDHLGYLKA